MSVLVGLKKSKKDSDRVSGGVFEYINASIEESNRQRQVFFFGFSEKNNAVDDRD